MDGDVERAVGNLEEPRIVIGAHIGEDVVAYQEAFEVLGRRVVVEPEDVDAAGDMTGDVVGEGHVPHGGPGRGAAVVADRELDGEADLSGHPDVLEDVAVHEDALGILELEEVLDHPQRSEERRVGKECRTWWSTED